MWVANCDISISISQNEKWWIRCTSVANSISRRYFFVIAERGDRFQTKLSHSQAGPEERDLFLSWLLEVMNDPLCNRGTEWRGDSGGGVGFDTDVRTCECITNVLYTLRASYFASRLDEKFINCWCQPTPQSKSGRTCLFRYTVSCLPINSLINCLLLR